MRFINYQQEAAIRDLIIENFNLQEIRTLSADMGVRYEDLAGDTLTVKIRELCAYVQRQNIVENLLNHCVRLRPNTNWWEVWNQSGSNLISIPHIAQLPDFIKPLVENLGKYTSKIIYVIVFAIGNRLLISYLKWDYSEVIKKFPVLGVIGDGLEIGAFISAAIYIIIVIFLNAPAFSNRR